MRIILIGLATGAAVVAAHALGLLVVYDFFRFDLYLAIVAVTFLAVGYWFTSGKENNQGSAAQTTALDTSSLIIARLSSRELTILKMIATGNTNKEIASNLSIEVSTVKSHVNNVYTKINVANRKEAREICNAWLRSGLIS